MAFTQTYRPPSGGKSNTLVEGPAPTGEDDGAALTTAAEDAAFKGADLVLRPGRYKVLAPLAIEAAMKFVHWRGSGDTTIEVDSRDTHAIDVEGGAQAIRFSGINFEGWKGAGYNNKTINKEPAIRLNNGVIDIDIDGCFFDSVQSLLAISGDNSSRLTFTRNRVVDAPLALVPPSKCFIAHNFFEDRECYVDPIEGIAHSRSHAIYAFGRCEEMKILVNFFKNQSTATIEIRANDAPRLQKRGWDISHNTFENTSPLYAIYASSLGSEIVPGAIVFQSNIFRNAGGPYQLTGLRNAIVDGNIIETDYEYPAIFPHGGTGITVTSAFDSGETSVSSGITLSNNKVVNRHPFWAVATISSAPADGDTITIGGVTYTWRASPSVSGDVQINANVDDCGLNLVTALQGKGLTLQNKVLRDNTDVWSTTNEAPSKVWVASGKTFAFSETGTGVTCSAVNDFSNVMAVAYDISNAKGVKLDNNTAEGVQLYKMENCIDPELTRNTCTSPPTGIAGLSRNCSMPIFDGNTVKQNRRFSNPEILSQQMWLSYDAFPIIRNCGILLEQSGGAGVRTLPSMMGQSGIVKVGNGRARQIFYYGREVSVTQPGAADLGWRDGHEVLIWNNATQVLHTFTFKRESPSEASKEFNSYATLLAAINNQTSGSWTAVNPVVDWFGSDLEGYGYIELIAGAVGTTRNLDELEINQDKNGRTGPRTCGVYLKPWATGEPYSNFSQSGFIGGAATAIKTAVFTPLASNIIPIRVTGVDAASQALNPIVYMADVYPGVGFAITHDAPAGDPPYAQRFAWSMG